MVQNIQHPSLNPSTNQEKPINMNIQQSKLPMSPSLSATSISRSTSASTPYSTQAPASVKESLPSYGSLSRMLISGTLNTIVKASHSCMKTYFGSF
jgi:hypothetical protein